MKQISPLKAHLGFWMRFVSNHVSYSFARKLEDSGVTVAEWVILRELYEINKPVSPSIVSEVTGLTRGAISKLVDRLISKKLIKRKFDNEDKRYQHIELSSEATKLVPKLASLADQNDDEFFSCLTKHEKTELKKMMEKIVKANGLSQLPTE